MSDDARNPYDGKPFYCEACYLGWSEFMACEEVDCKLESPERALARQKAKAKDEQLKRCRE